MTSERFTADDPIPCPIQSYKFTSHQSQSPKEVSGAGGLHTPSAYNKPRNCHRPEGWPGTRKTPLTMSSWNCSCWSQTRRCQGHHREQSSRPAASPPHSWCLGRMCWMPTMASSSSSSQTTPGYNHTAQPACIYLQTNRQIRQLVTNGPVDFEK